MSKHELYEVGLELRIKKLEYVLRDVTEMYQELVDDAGGCDHSVGICWCEDYALIRRAKEVLDVSD